MYGEDLKPEIIFEMVTINSEKAFWMQDRIGTLEEGKLGDIMVLKARTDDPYENLVSASMEDIELLVLAGNPIYGERRFLDIFDNIKTSKNGGGLPSGYSEIVVDKRPMFVIGDPADLYIEIRKRIGYNKVLDFLPFEPNDNGVQAAKETIKPKKESK